MSLIYGVFDRSKVALYCRNKPYRLIDLFWPSIIYDKFPRGTRIWLILLPNALTYKQAAYNTQGWHQAASRDRVYRIKFRKPGPELGFFSHRGVTLDLDRDPVKSFRQQWMNIQYMIKNISFDTTCAVGLHVRHSIIRAHAWRLAVISSENHRLLIIFFYLYLSITFTVLCS